MNSFKLWFSPFRLKMFFSHLGISLLIAIFSLYWVFFIWHPYPLATAVGVTDIFLMMLIIDTILGPLLTLVIADQAKRSFKFDLGVIALIQISALVYGMYSIGQSRPVWIVFDQIRFDLVQARDIPTAAIQQAEQPYDHLSWLKPDWTATKLARDAKERSDRLFQELDTGVAPSMQPNLYQPLRQHLSEVVDHAMPLQQLYRFNAKSEVDQVIKQNQSASAWLPLKASNMDMVVLIKKQPTEIIKIVNLRPWK